MSYTGSQAQAGLSTTFSIGTTGGSPTYTVIGEILEISQNGKQNTFAETTNLQSSGKEWLPTLLDPGEFQMTLNRVPGDAGQVALKTAFDSKTINPYKIILPKTATQTTAGDTYSFSAFCSAMDDISGLGPEKVIQMKVTVKVTGAVTLTAGS